LWQRLTDRLKFRLPQETLGKSGISQSALVFLQDLTPEETKGRSPGR
jgi:hypothetical protein